MSQPRIAPNGNKLPEELPIGHRLVDTTKRQWLIGPSIGSGGFGEIYLTKPYDKKVDDLKRQTKEQITRESSKWTHVIKFEHFSGPLFAEINFYLRCAKQETIEEYMAAKKLKHLGMPRFIASGIYDPLKSDNPPPVCRVESTPVKEPLAKRRRQAAPAIVATNGVDKKPKATNGTAKAAAQAKGKKYRFLVLQRFGDDVQKVWMRAKQRFDMNTAFNIALKVIDTLEFIHSHGYVHADIKASNLLLSLESKDEIYLIDYGLVERFYNKDGTHREYAEDQRRANNGTVEFSSRDAHIGAFSRRSDLESLAYNLLYWVSRGRLPWTHILKDHQAVETSKKWYMNNLEMFLDYCFDDSIESNSSTSLMCSALYELLDYIQRLKFEDEPDYNLIRSILTGSNTTSRTTRKRRSGKIKAPPKTTKCEIPTPAMREILKKIRKD